MHVNYLNIVVINRKVIELGVEISIEESAKNKRVSIGGIIAEGNQRNPPSLTLKSNTTLKSILKKNNQFERRNLSTSKSPMPNLEFQICDSIRIPKSITFKDIKESEPSGFKKLLIKKSVSHISIPKLQSVKYRSNHLTPRVNFPDIDSKVINDKDIYGSTQNIPRLSINKSLETFQHIKKDKHLVLSRYDFKNHLNNLKPMTNNILYSTHGRGAFIMHTKYIPHMLFAS